MGQYLKKKKQSETIYPPVIMAIENPLQLQSGTCEFEMFVEFEDFPDILNGEETS